MTKDKSVILYPTIKHQAMKQQQSDPSTSRRSFIGLIAAGAAALGLSSLIAPIPAQAEAPGPPTPGSTDVTAADAWMKNNIKGKRRMVFDVPQPHDVFPFAWPKVFQLTNMATGTPEKDTTVVVVLRHSAIPYAMNSSVWQKYNFGEVFKVDDPATKTAAVRNAFWMPNKGDFKVPGLGEVEIGINELQSKGVLFCVCDTAMTVYSAGLAEGTKGDAVAIRKDWVAGLLPGIQVVPSGVWAIGRAQDYGCAYCFAG
jgi:intracellular sulfur oxidation DsrE/DsrF family protein